MSVPYGDRSRPKLETIVKAMELTAYTIKICANTNVFKAEYNSLLTQDIVHCAKEIYGNAWKANNINVTKNNELKSIRLEYQTKAIANCYELLALIQLAKPVYHLTSKRIKYWGGLVLEVRQMLKAWRESDNKRYNS